MQNLRSSERSALKSSLDMSLVAEGGPVVPDDMARGELLALFELAGFALFGSELAGVGWRRADKLALLMLLFVSEFAVRGGDADCVRGGVRRGGAAGIAGRGPWGFRALVVARRGSIMTACAACSWSCCACGERLGASGT